MGSAATKIRPDVTPEAMALIPKRRILLGFRGSVAHGTYRPPEDETSVDDVDLMAVHIGPIEHYLGFRRKGQETVDRTEGKWDVVSYEVRHYFSLLKKCNPNVMQLLWLPDSMLVSHTREGRKLRSRRNIFLSKRAYHAFKGYAYSQFDKLEKREHRGYMGEKRKKLVERFAYDTKYASHLIRLIRTGCEYLRGEGLQLPRPDADELLAIKRGEYGLSQIRNMAEAGFDDLRRARDESPLPDEPEEDEIEQLLMSIIAGYHGLHLPPDDPPQD